MEIVIIALIAAAFLLWLFALIDIVRTEFESTTTKLLWLVIILIAPLLGAILYFALKSRFVAK